MKIHKGDTVIMLHGKDRKKKGRVIKVMPKSNKIAVEGLNLVTKHLKAKKQGQKGEKVKLPRAIPSSIAMLVCPKCGKQTRVGYDLIGEKKMRKCKKCSATFE